MALRSLHFCALAYLNQWLLQDAGHCQGLASGSQAERLTNRSKAAALYRISRNLPLAVDEQLGLHPLQRVRRQSGPAGLAQRTDFLPIRLRPHHEGLSTESPDR
jgi:hypothetical protein